MMKKHRKKKPKKTREGVILAGPDRGKKAIVDNISERKGTCRVTVGENQYRIFIDAVSFENETPKQYNGVSPDDELELAGFTIE